MGPTLGEQLLLALRVRQLVARYSSAAKKGFPEALVDGQGTVHGILNSFPERKLNDVALNDVPSLETLSICVYNFME